MKLQRIPEAKAVAVCQFNSIEDASNAVISTMKKGNTEREREGKRER